MNAQNLGLRVVVEKLRRGLEIHDLCQQTLKLSFSLISLSLFLRILLGSSAAAGDQSNTLRFLHLVLSNFLILKSNLTRLTYNGVLWEV